jgi:hypothetical protein
VNPRRSNLCQAGAERIQTGNLRLATEALPNAGGFGGDAAGDGNWKSKVMQLRIGHVTAYPRSAACSGEDARHRNLEG